LPKAASTIALPALASTLARKCASRLVRAIDDIALNRKRQSITTIAKGRASREIEGKLKDPSLISFFSTSAPVNEKANELPSQPIPRIPSRSRMDTPARKKRNATKLNFSRLVINVRARRIIESTL
jgi:hypothetical protein